MQFEAKTFSPIPLLGHVVFGPIDGLPQAQIVRVPQIAARQKVITVGNSLKDRVKDFEKFEAVTIDGQDFYVRHLRNCEISRLRDAHITILQRREQLEKEGTPKDALRLREQSSLLEGFESLKFALFCADEHGKRLFSDDEEKSLNISDAIRFAVIHKGEELNPLYGERVREEVSAAKKDSGEVLTNTNGMSSPAISGNGTLTD